MDECKEKNKKIDNRGFTFVEVLCAVAILAMVIAAVGSIMVFTSKTYTSGSRETTLQQELQVAVNHIEGIVQNSSDVKPTGNIVNFETSVGEYVLTWTGTDTKQLKLEQKAPDGSSTGEQLLAENITAFTAKADDFESTKTVELSIQVTDKTDTSKKYNMTYNMSARNGAVTTVAVGDLVPAATLVCDDYLVLVPGQEYTIPVEVRGMASGITVSKIGDKTLEHMSWSADNKITVKVPKSADGDDVYRLKVETTAKDEALNPLSTRNIEIRVRRATGVSVACPSVTPGKAAVAGTVYRFVSTVSGTNFARVLGAVEWENGFMDPRSAKWEVVELTVGGTPKDWTEYFEQVGMSEEFTDEPPYIAYKLKADVAADTKLTVKATALHPNGRNKAGIDYNKDGVYGTYTLTLTPSGVPSEDPVSGSAVIVMEPQEEKTVAVAGGDGTWVLGQHSSSDTRAEYVAGNATIKLGKDEEGTEGKFKYTSADSVLDVLVRRVNEVSFSSESSDNIKSNNKTNSTVTLTAQADGTYLSELPEYESDYVSPYKLKWEIITPSDDRMDIDAYTNFISDVTYSEDVSGAQTVSFKLKQPLLDGTRIRATSMHAAGENKTTLVYADVYAELRVSTIGGIKRVHADFRRGATNYNMYTNDDVRDKVYDLMYDYYITQDNDGGHDNDTQGRYFFRYREAGAEWTQNYLNVDTSEKTILIQDSESYLLHPSKQYEYEIIYVVFNSNTKEVYWPWNDVLFESGRGFAENGYYFGEFAKHSREVYGDTHIDDCVSGVFIDKADLMFEYNEKWGQYLKQSHYFGEHSVETNPIPIEAYTIKACEVDIPLDAILIEYDQTEGKMGHFYADVQKKAEDGSWVDVDASSSNAEKWLMHAQKAGSYTVTDIYGAKGLYRFGSKIKDWNNTVIRPVDGNGNSIIIDPFKYNLTSMPSSYLTETKLDANFYDWETGKNVVYVEFEGYGEKGDVSVEVDTKKNGGPLDIASLKSGEYIDIEYTETFANGGVLYVQSSATSKYVEINPSKTYNASNKEHARFTYEDIVSAYGSSDLSTIDKVGIKAVNTEMVIVDRIDMVTAAGGTIVWGKEDSDVPLEFEPTDEPTDE